MGMMHAVHQRISSLYGWIIVGMMSVMSSPVWAQVEGLKPPRAKEAPSSPKFLMMGVVLVLLALTVVVVTLKAKRGHQD